MENSTPPTDKDVALDGLLNMLATELEGALEVIASFEGPSRMAEILSHCFNAAALAKATQMLVAKPTFP